MRAMLPPRCGLIADPDPDTNSDARQAAPRPWMLIPAATICTERRNRTERRRLDGRHRAPKGASVRSDCPPLQIPSDRPGPPIAARSPREITPDRTANRPIALGEEVRADGSKHGRTAASQAPGTVRGLPGPGERPWQREREVRGVLRPSPRFALTIPPAQAWCPAGPDPLPRRDSSASIHRGFRFPFLPSALGRELVIDLA